MFEWLEREISEIKTPGFHSIDGPANARMQNAILKSGTVLPTGYREFVLRYGNARLYRRSYSGYRVGVFAGPRSARLDNGQPICHVGFHEGARIYVKPLTSSEALPIYEFEEGPERKVADNFEEWLEISCTNARKVYGKAIWAKILHGPKPFTIAENQILEARRMMLWRVLGLDPAGRFVFEVTNKGQYLLQALTIGVRSKDERLNGAVRLNVGDIGPGEKKLLQVDCYKDLVRPEEIEVFDFPEPKPEERDYFWEFDGPCQ
jgi:hypothetical protein